MQAYKVTLPLKETMPESLLEPVIDWDLAYSNVRHVENSADYPPHWVAQSTAFRKRIQVKNQLISDVRYGSQERNVLDLFMPDGSTRGLMIFVHGGYWVRFDKDYFSFLAEGALAHGFAVAIPSYTLCPQAKISQITKEIAAAIGQAASMVAGPIHLSGHSAGGQLVARMGCMNSPLPASLIKRLRKIVSISGLHDLRPLLHLKMNDDFRLDLTEARIESPALLEPLEGIDVTAWAGADELPEFVRQNQLLANLWGGLGCKVDAVEEPKKHHMNIIDGLALGEHPLIHKLLCQTDG